MIAEQLIQHLRTERNTEVLVDGAPIHGVQMTYGKAIDIRSVRGPRNVFIVYQQRFTLPSFKPRVGKLVGVYATEDQAIQKCGENRAYDYHQFKVEL